ncbi:hypothetical protein MP228_008338 [Amoeboaphelidium protococcarum]|nr:hypothetical protein MP228_008338 [Amoeboaphelidium protococcarum]
MVYRQRNYAVKDLSDSFISSSLSRQPHMPAVSRSLSHLVLNFLGKQCSAVMLGINAVPPSNSLDDPQSTHHVELKAGSSSQSSRVHEQFDSTSSPTRYESPSDQTLGQVTAVVSFFSAPPACSGVSAKSVCCWCHKVAVGHWREDDKAPPSLKQRRRNAYIDIPKIYFRPLPRD